MARRKRSFTAFNLSFLDIMSCGFGAVVLVFLIIDHAIEEETRDLNRDLLSEVSLLEEDIRDGEAGLVRLRNDLGETDAEIVEAQGRATRVTEELDRYEALIAAAQDDGFTDTDAVERLKAEVQSLEEEVKKLREASASESGKSARDFTGDGQRQYLTGLNLGGQRIAILVDTSASMLDERLVNIIRLRNMSEQVQREAAKWVRTLKTVDWLTAQLPIGSDYQLIAFNTEARPVLPETEGQWLEVANQEQITAASSALRRILPGGGTSLLNAFTALQKLSPAPDNIFLITDGLPTQGANPPRGSTVSGPERQRLYREAIRSLPGNIPINIILFPMEGDPMAASEFWQLAQATRGSFMSPSRDWP
ncbi:VWA domain-containing protein [Chromatocurvus halotolerans]|uniref:von Willebrand factor type A domain-containing protein n=1 Tax=Chromatocurvus halotolerans TaxID=1132028 RepID=A0A4R2KPT0_9GAMM|nr:VWA domain-containing protein [Chromatocurvus halotolerans]TCO74657.1 von Willebrand factor type A domain-containing protein [Chromatocurvus halotolerans]